LSVPELRRLLWRLVLVVPQTLRHILAWSQWRRRHQTIAQYDHDKRREALVGTIAAYSSCYHCSTRPALKRMHARIRYVLRATQIGGMTAFSEVPKKVLLFRFCLISLKNRSMV
jgi:hypothetical protein